MEPDVGTQVRLRVEEVIAVEVQVDEIVNLWVEGSRCRAVRQTKASPHVHRIRGVAVVRGGDHLHLATETPEL